MEFYGPIFLFLSSFFFAHPTYIKQEESNVAKNFSFYRFIFFLSFTRKLLISKPKNEANFT